MDKFIHFLSWTRVWMAGEYLNGTTKVRVVARKERIAWYLPSCEMLFVQDLRNVQDSWINSRTCKNQELTWLECVRESLSESGETSIRSLLLDLPAPRKEEIIAVDSVCDVIQSNLLEEWQPSPSTEEKQKLIALITAEVKQRLDGKGAIIDTICNDFNADDPEVYALVESTGEDDKRGLTLFSIVLNRKSSFCKTYHIDFEPSLPKMVVDRIRAKSIRLDLEGSPWEPVRAKSK